MRLTKFDTLESLIELLKTNPSWISGFVRRGRMLYRIVRYWQTKYLGITTTSRVQYSSKQCRPYYYLKLLKRYLIIEVEYILDLTTCLYISVRNTKD